MPINEQLLKELKEQLTKEKLQIQEDLQRIAKQNGAGGSFETKFNDIGEDEDENASEVEEYTDNLALENNLENQLKEIDEALGRIEAGTYGYCLNCNKEIDPERLKAYPAAKNCVECK